MTGGDGVEDITGTAVLRATLCGRVTVTGHGSVLGPRELGGTKPRHILIALLLRAGQPVTKARLVEALWGDAPPSGATGTLEGYVSLLRKRIEPLHPGQDSPVRTVPGGYLADPSLVEVDVERFRALVAAARRPGNPPTRALVDYAAGLLLVEGGLVPDELAPSWLEEERRAHAALVGKVVVEAGMLALDADQPVLAEHWARRALDRDAFDETAWRVLLESLEVRGLHADGVRAYDTCRRLFDRELGCAPGPGVRAAFSRLLAGTRGDDGGLGSLLQAVLRVHAELSPPPLRSVERTGDATGLEEACRALDALIATARHRCGLRVASSA
ncbi:hypothetical protein ASD62_02385 [Phycicoccus sp. Root563]|uniref:AfsR/SARP family transcriptional regulator n=1 Tax=Phycicoccus sp. Root563 TaxID=1736562 RepID=UPI0007032496|nr:BTAD domain-containing putative transcriptional regulator [Phycicoccus sp. Root563]KQZ88343.1 hypothetical protein ASD62_02385 [Phycicoccus sp. Root563]